MKKSRIIVTVVSLFVLAVLIFLISENWSGVDKETEHIETTQPSNKQEGETKEETTNWQEEVTESESTELVEPDVTSFEYEVYEERDGAIITKYFGKGKQVVVVPSKIDQVLVEEIGPYTFSENDEIETIIISEGIRSLTWGSIRQCRNLKKIVLPASLEFCEALVYECPNLETIEVAEKSQNFVVKDGILYNKEMTQLICCPAKNPIERLVIPDTVKSISWDAFADHETIKEVVFPDTLETIGSWAFNRCSALEKINIPRACTTIGQCAFQSAPIQSFHIPKEFRGSISTDAFTELTRVTVEEGNLSYEIKDDSLIYKEVTLLYYFGKGFDGAYMEEYIMPDYVYYVEPYAFWYKWNSWGRTKKLQFSKQLRRIGCNAFDQDGIVLEELRIPGGMKEINFGDIPKAKTYYLPKGLIKLDGIAYLEETATFRYYGTEEEWNQLLEKSGIGSFDFSVTYNHDSTHTHEFLENYVTKATATEKAKRHMYCHICGETKIETI